jgi:predicted  nucleic acid-binding Zn-ribbon protein
VVEACPKCGAVFEAPLEEGERCPECGARTSGARRRQDDVDDDRPVRSRPKKSGGKALLVVLGIGLGSLLLCCGGGIAAYLLFVPKEVEIIDASRQKTNDGGTASVTVILRVRATHPGNRVDADYVFMAKSGNRTHLHRVSLRGDGGAEYRTALQTPELAKENGPVDFWVERDNRGSASRVSKVVTIP